MLHAQGSRKAPGSREDGFIDSVMSLMTTQEKIGQLVQYSGGWDTGPTGGKINAALADSVKAGRVGSLLNVVGSNATRTLQKVAVEQSRLKIPLLFGLDVIHGFKTTFPIPLASASSWNPSAAERAERVAAQEAASAGIHWTFAPMVDIARDPRWGRIAEGSGEDPYLGSLMAAARVRGFQGTSLTDKTAIMACAKHYAAYGGAEGGRDYNTVDISERTLRDVYLPPFHSAVKAGVGTLMASFNEIGGVPSSGNRNLLTEILRDEWKFDGFVVSDWGSIREMIPHGYAASLAMAGERAINAGLDMDMESNAYRDQLAMLLKAGAVSGKTLDESVRRILRMKYRLGLFADPYRGSTPEREQATLLSAANLMTAREVARESIVLLKNDKSVLPLDKNVKSIAVIGPLGNNRADLLGPWAGPADSNTVVTLLAGLKAAVPEATITFTQGTGIVGEETSGIESAVNAAKSADVVILAVGESESMSGEASCRSFIGLPGRQLDLVKAVVATGKPVVLVLMNGRPLAIQWEASHVPAILEAWFLGSQTGNAIADVLFGDASPSGRLPVSFPRVTGQVPIYYNHKNTGRPTDDIEHYTSRYLDLPSSPLFPFGFGLTYTTFAYENLQIERATLGMNDSLRVTVRLKNTGTRAGDEVVQLYIHNDVASVTRPVKELKAFRKVHVEKGETVSVALSVAVEDLAFTGLDMKTKVEPGSFKVFVGPNSSQGLQGSFIIAGKY
jgi:beta-glucosidase